jgi:PhnB protein
VKRRIDRSFSAAQFWVARQSYGNLCALRHALPETYRKPQGFSVMLNVGSVVEADDIFNALAADGTVQVALQESLWVSRFGMVVDQFGTPWTINCGKPLPSF